MIKILSQDKEAVYDFEENNVFVCGNKILISDKVNIYEGKAACLGIYNNEEEAKYIFLKTIETLTKLENIEDKFYCLGMPTIKQTKEDVSNKTDLKGVAENGGK